MEATRGHLLVALPDQVAIDCYARLLGVDFAPMEMCNEDRQQKVTKLWEEEEIASE